MAAHDAHLRNYAAPRKAIAEVWRLADDPHYIEKTIQRLEVFDDVPVLKTPGEIRAALERWRHVLYPVQVEALERWLANCKVV